MLWGFLCLLFSLHGEFEFEVLPILKKKSKSSDANGKLMQLGLHLWHLKARQGVEGTITGPTLKRGKSFSKVPLVGDMLVFRRVRIHDPTAVVHLFCRAAVFRTDLWIRLHAPSAVCLVCLGAGFDGISSPNHYVPSWKLTYCWWTKSCTTKDDDYPIVYRGLTIPDGAGFCPSTVSVTYPLAKVLLSRWFFLFPRWVMWSFLRRVTNQFLGEVR